jgi:hypothetical protein
MDKRKVLSDTVDGLLRVKDFMQNGQQSKAKELLISMNNMLCESMGDYGERIKACECRKKDAVAIDQEKGLIASYNLPERWAESMSKAIADSIREAQNQYKDSLKRFYSQA